MYNVFFRELNLQLFADGGGASAGSAGGEGGTSASGANGVTAGASLPATKGVTGNQQTVLYGKQDATEEQVANAQQSVPQISPEDRVKKFDELIKGEYKDLYDARMQDTIQKRLKSTKETVDRYNALSPSIDMLSKRYGVDPSDIGALTKAIEEDDSFYEEEALEKGVSVEDIKHIHRMERENADLKRQMDEIRVRENADRIYAGWMDQSRQLSQVYPSFDLDTEMHNEKFTSLLRNGVDVRTAYEVIHKDEIIPAAMQFTAKTVQQKMANSIMANGTRPTENGMNSAATPIVKSDVSQLSRADREEINRRVARGEKIRF